MSGKSRLPPFEPLHNNSIETFVDHCGIFFASQSRAVANATYGPQNVKLFEERFAKAYKATYPGLAIPKLFTLE